MASAFVRLTKRWLNVVNSEYWEAVLLIVLYFILRWFPTLRGIAVVILASSCVSIINELIFRYGALYLRIHTWDMLSKESRYDMGSDMINGVWGSMGGLLISIAFVPFLPIYIVAMPFVIIYALVKYRRPKDKNISIFWFKIGAFFYTNFVSEYHEMISVVSESGGEQFDAFEEWAFLPPSPSVNDDVEIGNIDAVNNLKGDDGHSPPLGSIPDKPPTEAADEDMDGDGEEDEEAKETLSWVMEKIFSSVYYMPLIPVVFFLLFMFFLFGIALLICAVPAAIFATVAVFCSICALLISGKHVSIFVVVILEVIATKLDVDLGGHWSIELAVWLTFLLPLAMYANFLFLERLIEAVFAAIRFDLGPRHALSKLTYIYPCIPVNAEEAALKISDGPYIHHAGRPPPEHFVAYVHGAEDGNELRFAFVEGTAGSKSELNQLLRDDSAKALDLCGKCWVGGEAYKKKQ